MKQVNRAAGLTRAERRERGRRARQTCSRQQLAVWDPTARTCNLVSLLVETNTDRIPGLLGVRYGRMAQSPFAFFRGTAILQARDLANLPSTDITVQACGDCHLLNFGGFATPERSLVFDINDFDETFPAPWEWDVKRLTASIVVAARHLEFPAGAAEKAVRAAVSSYVERMNEYSETTALDLWYTQIRLEDLLQHFRDDKDIVARLQDASRKGRSRTSESVFPKMTTKVDGVYRIADNPPFLYHFQRSQEHDWESRVADFIAQYKLSLQPDRRALLDRYCHADTAVKVVGVGSVGTRCFVSLYFSDGDPLFLQLKEARRSVLESPEGASRFAHQGERIVNGQRLMQSASDIFLGWLRIDDGREYYGRQLRDMKIATEIETFRPQTLVAYAEMCGWALARAHAKAGGAAEIAGYIGKSDQFEEALLGYAVAYADQVERDFEVFGKAVRLGQLHSDTEESSLSDFLL